MNTLKTTMFMAALTVLFVLVGQALGGHGGMVFAFALACIMNVGAYWFSDRIVLRMYRAREMTQEEAPGLYDMVKELSVRANLPMPRVYIIPGSAPNAFATGRNPSHAAVAVTEGIMGCWAMNWPTSGIGISSSEPLLPRLRGLSPCWPTWPNGL